ncbi:hypothetical protein MRX96_039585 [Rhipicephalus microplus]
MEQSRVSTQRINDVEPPVTFGHEVDPRIRSMAADKTFTSIACAVVIVCIFSCVVLSMVLYPILGKIKNGASLFLTAT